MRWARQGSVWPGHLTGPHLDRQAVSSPVMGLGVCSGHRRAQGSRQPLGRVAKPAVLCPRPSGLAKSGRVQHTAWSLMGQAGAAKVNRGFLPHGRGPRREFRGKPRHPSLWIRDGSHQNTRCFPLLPPEARIVCFYAPPPTTHHIWEGGPLGLLWEK